MKKIINEWETYFSQVFSVEATFESVAQRLISEIVYKFNSHFFQNLQSIQSYHAQDYGQYRDFFGDWIMNNSVSLDKGFDQVLTPYEVVDFMCQSTCAQLQKQFKGQPIQFIDPFCGTGRFALGVTAACLTSGIKDYTITCVDIDMRMIAYYITNMCLHKIDCHIMLGDVLDFRIDRAWRVQDGKLSEIKDFEYLYVLIGREPKEKLKQRDLI